MTTEIGQPAPIMPMARQCPFTPPDELHEMRASRPVSRASFVSGAEAWLVTGYPEVRSVLRDPRFSVKVPKSLHTVDDVAEQKPGRGSLFWQDPPDHTEDRRLLTAEFTVRRMQQLRPNIQRIVDEHLDAMEKAGPGVDLVRAFAVPVPSMVISDLFGVPDGDRAAFQEITADLLRLDLDLETWQAVTGRLFMFIYGLVQAKRAAPGDDLLSGLVTMDDPDGLITDEFLATLAATLLIAGHDTTACMIGLGTALLLDRPDQLALLHANPDLLNGAIEEMLRYLTIVHLGTQRVALEDVELNGQVIKAGDQVAVHIPAANFDPNLLTDPERFDITRKPTPHLAFGFGVHQCIGQQLARIELQVVFGTLLRRFPTLKLVVPADELSYRDDMVFYGVRELPVEW